VLGLGLEHLARDESVANRAPLGFFDGEGDELERPRIDRRLAEVGALDHEPRFADPEPDGSRSDVAHDAQPEHALIEGDEPIDVVGAEGEMVDSHGGAENSPFVDAHCHLDDIESDEERSAMVDVARLRGVTRFVVAGYSPDTFDRAIRLRCRDVRVGIGIHPWAVDEHDDATIERWIAAIPESLERADTFGEIGLDAVRARRRGVSLERQMAVFRRSLDIGRRAGLPIVLHVVHAHAEAQATIREAGSLPPIVVHGFVGPLELARAWTSLGATISFGGDVLRSARTLATAAAIPPSSVLLESDAPHGFAREGDSSPSIVVAIAEAIASRAGTSVARLAAATTENAERLFFRD